MPTSELLRWADHLERLTAGAAESPIGDWPPPEAVRPARLGAGGPGGEVLVWDALRRGIDPRGSGFELAADGPLWRRDDWAAVEVWTEAELCALHAFPRAARLQPELATLLKRRQASAVTWHLEHTQPDNATNRPWATHVFLLDGRPEARHYAAILLHNAQAGGLADPASRWILADVAKELRLAASDA